MVASFCCISEFHRIRENYGIAVGEVYASLVAPSWLECSTLCLEQQEGCVLFSFRAIYVNETERNCYLYSRGGCDESDYDSSYDSSDDLVRFDEKRNEILWETYLLMPLVSQRRCLFSDFQDFFLLIFRSADFNNEVLAF